MAGAMSAATIFLTNGAITKIAGNAIGQACTKPFIQCMKNWLSMPVKTIVNTADISSAIIMDMTKANRMPSYFLGIFFNS